MNNRQYTDQAKAKEYYALYNRVFKTGEFLKKHELEHIRKDGTKWYTEVSIALMRDAQGKPIGFRGVSGHH
jgi:PAS domain-containing protein